MLLDYPDFLLFLTAIITLNLIPGTDVLYIASQSLRSKRQGILAALGVTTGIGVYILLTSLGLAEILNQSPLLFNLVKILGSGYLLYLAWNMFLQKESNLVIIRDEIAVGLSAYYKGIYTTLLNPKVGIFFLTFLPQFVDPARGEIRLQLLSLGVCFIISGTIVNLMYALLFSRLKESLFDKINIQKWLDKLTAFIFVFIAVKIITSKQGI
ncbi:TPA: LysE family translocator [Legionella pneumophila]|nr:LysE family translocator [Legionella pneumophila]HCJ1112914.1 LysE family translocator [Legionella pneumophila]